MSTEAVQEGLDGQGEEAVDFEAEAPANADSGLLATTDSAAQTATPATEDPSAATATGEPRPEEAQEVKDPKDPMNMPPHGTEVFIGGIPKSATEAQILEFSEQAGAVHSVKLAKDPVNSEQNRGFGFVRYLAKDSADAAKARLHDTNLTGTESKVRISSSQAKNRVYVGNLPRVWTKEKILTELNANVKGLVNMDLVMSKENPEQNRGFAFLTFYNHECAAAGKHSLTDPAYSMEGKQLTVSYAEPKNTEVQQQSGQQIKAVYVGNLAPGATEEKLTTLFGKWGEVSKAVIPAATERRPEQRFGFVHFVEQSSADRVVADANAGEKPELDGNMLEVKAARPQPPQDSRQQFGMPGGGDGYASGRHSAGRGGMRGRGGSGRGYGPSGMHRGRARGGRAFQPYGRGAYGNYGPGFEAGYDDSYMGYGDGYGQAGFDPYAGGPSLVAPAASPGVTMVPMMLPSGQVGYVLQSADTSADYGDYGGPGPDRGHRDFGDYRGARGRGRGASRYRPY